MKLVFTWQDADPGKIAFGLDADYFAYEAEVPENFIPKQILQAVKNGYRPRVSLVLEGDFLKD
jgi:hypothetical protein|nr:MAG TPA: hypothetical protein [Caudoviricetes sp.]